MAWLTRRTRARLVRSGALTLAVALLVAAAETLGALAPLQARTTDLLFRARPAQAARATVIVAIDDASRRELVERHGAMADWPRTLYARAVDRLHTAGARVIALAILFEHRWAEDVKDAIANAGGFLVARAVIPPEVLEEVSAELEAHASAATSA